MNEQSQDPNKVGLNDFATVVSIIDACTERGAFKGNELFVVGQVRNKFAKFVDDNAEALQQQMQQPQMEPVPTEVTEEDDQPSFASKRGKDKKGE